MNVNAPVWFAKKSKKHWLIPEIWIQHSPQPDLPGDVLNTGSDSHFHSVFLPRIRFQKKRKKNPFSTTIAFTVIHSPTSVSILTSLSLITFPSGRFLSPVSVLSYSNSNISYFDSKASERSWIIISHTPGSSLLWSTVQYSVITASPLLLYLASPPDDLQPGTEGRGKTKGHDQCLHRPVLFTGESCFCRAEEF